jgi:cell division septum initiation protein DivIVA
MVDDMVHVLHDEDVEDEHKKDFCANETEKTINLQDEKQSLLDSLKASIEEMEDEVKDLNSEIKTLEEEIANNDKEVFEASELRQKEHKDFQDTFATMDTARRLIDKAATRLHKFYHPEMFKKKVKTVQDKALSDAGLSLAVKRMKASFGQEDDSFAQTKVVLRHHARKVAPPVLPDTPGTYEKKESGGVLGLMNDMKEELLIHIRQRAFRCGAIHPVLLFHWPGRCSGGSSMSPSTLAALGRTGAIHLAQSRALQSSGVQNGRLCTDRSNRDGDSVPFRMRTGRPCQPYRAGPYEPHACTGPISVSGDRSS